MTDPLDTPPSGSAVDPSEGAVGNGDEELAKTLQEEEYDQGKLRNLSRDDY